MSKIGLIIQREYLTRVRKKSFIIMTILGPVLMAALFIVPVWLAMNEEDDANILVIDDSMLFHERMEDTEKIHFHFPEYGLPLDSAKSRMMGSEDIDAVLFIHKKIISTPAGVQLIYDKQPGINVIRYIENTLENDIETFKLAKSGINQATIEAAKTNITLVTTKLDEVGEESKANTELSMVVGLFSGILIYMFIFLYGVQVMRGVIEEKTNRIIEVIISSVRPFELMMGKIIGIALVGLTQFLLWVVLSSTLISGSQTLVQQHFAKQEKGTSIEEAMSRSQSLAPESEEIAEAKLNEAAVNELFSNIDLIDFPVILGSFLFYFLGGYLIYSALFAAVGSAVDNEADTQQFMLPITIPIIFSFVMAQVVINNPESTMSFWLSMIPFTSPIIMMVRIPFGVPYWEIALSMALLVAGFIATTWLAGRIYRTGILMYGKKITYKELWKWLVYH
ncbi:MAG: ABC transporter permease [Flavobacteriales bacterium]|nr:ABC transporter permease [Flavobacteriales bacterium]